MRIISQNTLFEYGAKHPETRPSLTHWHQTTKASAWNAPLDVVASFPKAKALNNDRVRFEISGGNYRMIVAFDFRRQIAFVKFLGTHAEYDRIDALTVSIF